LPDPSNNNNENNATTNNNSSSKKIIIILTTTTIIIIKTTIMSDLSLTRSDNMSTLYYLGLTNISYPSLLGV
jgi:hypothetical protein